MAAFEEEPDRHQLLSRLVAGQLDPVPAMRSVAQAERFLDRLAAELGLPCRSASDWTNANRMRRVIYTDPASRLELTVSISEGPTVDRQTAYRFSGLVRRIDGSWYRRIPARSLPANFERDVIRTVAKARAMAGQD